jgi:hypothetical protein
MGQGTAFFKENDMLALLPLLMNLANQGISIYQQMHSASSAGNASKVLALLPIAASVFDALQNVRDVLAKAQAEGWTDDDPRWAPVFDDANKALADAEARLTAPD